MTGQHRKGVTVTFDANLPAVRKYIDDTVAVAVNQAAHAIRAVREWCDAAEAAARSEELCSRDCRARFEARMELIEEVRALLPPVPEAAGEVDMGTRVTRDDDREYPGGGEDDAIEDADSGN